MTDLEHVLGPRLHDLADHLVEPSATVPAGTAIARYRRQRRARAGLAAVAATVALIAIGVPTAMTTLGAGHPAGGSTARPGTPSPHVSVTPPTKATGGAGVTTPVKIVPPTPGAAADAQAALEQAQLKSSVALLAADGPVRLTSPAHWGSCPNAAPGLSYALHTDVVYWQGSLPGGPGGCQFANTAGTSGTSVPENRLSVGIGFLTGTTTQQMQASIASSDGAAGSRCTHVDADPVAPRAELQRCTLSGEVRTYLSVPDAGGAGIWVLGVTVGDRYPGDGADALAAITRAAQAAFGG